MRRQNIMRQVDHYYVRNDIAAISFLCPRKALCDRAGSQFVTAREAYVGANYESNSSPLPRILFISLDPGGYISGPNHCCHRTWKYQQEYEEKNCIPSLLHKAKHWYETYWMAFEIIRGITPKYGLSIEFDEMYAYFAHTNSAKCKNLGDGKNRGPHYRFTNCRPFIAGEVKCLAPDIIITQGAEGFESVDNAFPVKSVIRNPHITLRLPNFDINRYEILDIDGRDVFKYRTFHPRNGLYQRQKDTGFDWFSRECHAAF